MLLLRYHLLHATLLIIQLVPRHHRFLQTRLCQRITRHKVQTIFTFTFTTASTSTLLSFKPTFHYANFHRNFPARKVVDTDHESRGLKRWQIMKFRWKSPTQIMKVTDINRLDMSRCLRQSVWQVCDKPVCVTVMEFSPLQYTRKVGDIQADLLPLSDDDVEDYTIQLQIFMTCPMQNIIRLHRFIS